MNYLIKIPNKYFILFFALILLLLILEELVNISIPLWNSLGILLTVFVVSFLAKNGHFFSSKWFARAQIAVPFILVGALFKIQHYPFASTLIMIGFAIVLICYAAYFITKKNKNVIDMLKLLWIAAEITGRALKINHYPYGKELLYVVSPLLLFLLLVTMVTVNIKKNSNWIHE